ncbi:hypothetical protein QFC21_001866 [Naganishia friedmannii]|uniref:Uncharacterized protein n=1 Tax=Naganishia friedmannii TaxID=89922 RepID=A0ACC2W316_9TREE|nr:hypothetical protein QFC21_001866 [Naganishia friedmannii]
MSSFLAPQDKPSHSTELTPLNVALALLFVVFDSLLSVTLGLGIASSLLIAASRCILQLSVMGLVLEKVFATGNIFGVFGIAALLNFLGAIEATFNKSKRRFTNMFPLVLLSMLCSTVPISIIGTQFAMNQRPFWQPDQFVPIVGMILGNAISAIGVSMNYVQKEFVQVVLPRPHNRDKIETYLSFGATRFEACRPIATEALKLALLPTINQMSVIGGKSVTQAAMLQMIIMFMIAASSFLCVSATLVFALSTLVDGSHRIRMDRLDSRKPLFYRWRDQAGMAVWRGIKKSGRKVTGRGAGGEAGSEEERQGLLGNQESR